MLQKPDELILCAAGLVQAIFTVSVLIFFIPVYYSFYLSLIVAGTAPSALTLRTLILV